MLSSDRTHVLIPLLDSLIMIKALSDEDLVSLMMIKALSDEDLVSLTMIKALSDEDLARRRFGLT